MFDRRQFLGATVALPLATAGWAGNGAAREAGPPGPRVLVIGAGIIGSSIAYHLAKGGAKVVVVDKARPGMGVTQGAFATLLATHLEGPSELNELYARAVRDWHRLESELPRAFAIQWGGMLRWAAPGAAATKLDREIDALVTWGSPVRRLQAADIPRLVPGVVVGPFGTGMFGPEHGTLDPLAATVALVERSRRLGVEYRYPCTVKGLTVIDGRIAGAATDGGLITADVVVLCSGETVAELAAAIGTDLPIGFASGTLAHSQPFKPVLGRVLVSATGSLKQDRDGRFVTGRDYAPGADGDDVSEVYGRKLLQVAAERFPAMRGARLDRMTFGKVPIPRDRRPITGFDRRFGNLYIASMMSGITLAPLMGRLVADEILSGRTPADLLPFGPARFLST